MHPIPEGAWTMERRRDVFGWLGLASGLVALALALLPGWIAPIYAPPSKPIEQSAVDLMGAVKDRVVGAIKNEPVPLPPPLPGEIWQKRAVLTSLLAGFAALMLGILAFVRHEEPRLTACAIVLGAGAIATQFIFTALLILAFAVLTGAILARYS
jgi:hypothetical protein